MFMLQRVPWQKLARPKVLVSIGLLAGVVGLGVWFYQYNQTPVAGVVHPPVSPRAEAQTKGASSTAHFKSTTIAFDYPSHYSTVETKEIVKPIIEQYSLRMHDGGQSIQIGISVKRPLAGEPVTEDSAYKFRSISVQDYAPSDVEIGGQTIKKMTKKDGTEVTYFIPGNGLYAIIAGTTNNPKDSFEQDIAKLAESFAWVQ